MLETIPKKHIHRITNSWTIKDARNWMRKNKWFGAQPLTEHMFYLIVREVGKAVAEKYITTGYMTFPRGMGELVLAKRKIMARVVDGKLVGGIVDWAETYKLWNSDPEAKKDKIFVRYESDFYRTYYKKNKARYKNRIYYLFHLHKALRKRLSKNISDGIVDTCIIR